MVRELPVRPVDQLTGGAGDPVHYVVDGMNVIGSRPNGWWRDRAGAVRRLLEQLRRLAADSDDAFTVVVDGREMSGVRAGAHEGVDVRFAGHGRRDAADDLIVAIVPALQRPVCVVTSDRELAARVRDLGARVMGARALLDRLDEADG